ncbi:MAG: hypothetical protein FWF77_08415 [Defluviitaleaceae bacterium]|nr:hypothetical protein [Defluviitaleaceae bacterium]
MEAVAGVTLLVTVTGLLFWYGHKKEKELVAKHETFMGELIGALKGIERNIRRDGN